MTAAPTRGVRAPLSTEVAAEIRAIMGKKGISSARLARLLGVSEAWTSRRISLNGDQTMDLEDLERIAAALEVPVVELLPRSLARALTPPLPRSSERRHRRPADRPFGRRDLRPSPVRPISAVPMMSRRPNPLRQLAGVR